MTPGKSFLRSIDQSKEFITSKGSLDPISTNEQLKKALTSVIGNKDPSTISLQPSRRELELQPRGMWNSPPDISYVYALFASLDIFSNRFDNRHHMAIHYRRLHE